jgi:hypothetical protein
MIAAIATEDAVQAAQKFLLKKFSPEAQYRPIHLTMESLADLLAEYEMNEDRLEGYYG